MKIIENRVQIREIVRHYQNGEYKTGLIPTMGNIHEGHIAQIHKAREMVDFVLVLVYVNPVLVGDQEVLARFDCSRQEDIETLEREEVDYVFFACRDEFFPAGHRTFVRPEKLIQRLQGLESDCYLTGLATADFQILNLFQPSFLFIAQKNFLDYHLLKKIIRDFNFSTEPVLCPTVRDENGLAYSAYNRFLDAEEKQAAARVYQALQMARDVLLEGEAAAAKIRQLIENHLREAPLLEQVSIGIYSPSTMEALTRIQQEAIIMINTRMRKMRFTDNIIFRRNS